VDAKVGSYIVMRHEVKNCRYLPNRLKDEAGKHIGPVYVIGRIVEVCVPYSDKDKRLADRLAKLNDFHTRLPYLHNFKRVRWSRMGMKEKLSKSTQNYINKICQPTLARICQKGKKGSFDADQVRRDLWDNAEFTVAPEDFKDVPEGFKDVKEG